MKKKYIWIILGCVVAGMLGAWTVRAYRNTYRYNDHRIPKEGKLILPDEEMRVAAANYSLSGPYSYNNLTIFLIHGKDHSKAQSYLTLSEAMEQKKVVVHETGEVSELAIENLSDQEVFVQSGEIVKGGKQDRVLAIDLVVPPKSGKIPIDSFCVEHGRWSGRGDESVAAFSESSKMLSSKDLKIAAKAKESQSEVWDKVAESRRKIAAGVVAADPVATPAPPRGDVPADPRNAEAYDFSLRGALSSSLQLGLEDDRLEDIVRDYVEKLKPIIDGKPDVIGYAFAINDKLNSADIYSSHALFNKLWPKLIESTATEAISEYSKDASRGSIDAGAVSKLLTEAETGAPEAKEVSANNVLLKRESESHLFFEMRKGKGASDWIHRNYIMK
ncbi:MAG: hypothetical protein IPM66_10255 [Acidobacteriota bacterium]|nr:MAG: hypothetical protein IPM66_10255 [Acidobacteriota bacterium]